MAMDLRSRLELGGEWARFSPCDEALRESCSPNLLPRLSPDTRFGVRLEGNVLDRVAVDVDFDQARDFGGDNRINISYEGGEDDILRSLDVGDVTFDLPRSRFLTEAVPAANFGFRAAAQVGPVDLQSVWAQQRGDVNTRVFRPTGLGDQKIFVQEDTLNVDDADYARGQFFYLIDPSRIADYPHFDPLELDPASGPSTLSPGVEPVQIYRLEDDPALLQQVEGYIQADAVAENERGRLVESGWFRLLRPGVDYFVHPSGLWLALGAPLAPDEMLAATFVTATGDTVGTYNPERLHNAGERPELRLLKASEALHQPGSPSWRHEMHNVYMVSRSVDVDPGSVGLTISLGELSAGRTFKRAPTGEDVTFLRLFGLDEEAPADGLDPAAVFSLRDEGFGSDPPVRGSFVFFPAQRPFAEPPPNPGLGLLAEDAADLLAEDANHRIYREEDPFARKNAGRFRLQLTYRLRSEGLISSFSLGALGIRPGSERIQLGERLLAPGVDYDIDYDLGQVTLRDPEQLFTTTPDAAIRVSWEQHSLFQVSPTQVYGVRARAGLGDGGEINLLTLYRSERSLYARPTLGAEPRSALLGGVGGGYQGSLLWLDRLLNAIPGVRTGGAGTFSLSGELAASRPNPNTGRFAFLDDFDGSTHTSVSLFAHDWLWGSAPAHRTGAEDALPVAVAASTAAGLVWQHAWIETSAVGDSLGLHEGYFPHLDIDRRIRVAGSERREPGLLLSFTGEDDTTVDGEDRWRALTTVLATNGMDLTRTEFLEFYAERSPGAALVIDLGSVSEDALVLDDAGRDSGIRSDGREWGANVLDQEADPRRGEVWSDEADSRGAWNETCLAERGRIYRMGDMRAVCTRGNGRPDGEDLDNDGHLDTSERHLRFTVGLDGSSRFLARSRTETETTFELYRIPLTGPGATEVGGPFTAAHRRAVRHLRITVAGSGARTLRLVRMRLTGSRWVKRAGTGALNGLAGDETGLGRVEVGAVSRVTEGEGYSPPPGVLETLADPTLAFAGAGIEFNERSLALTYEGLSPLGRAEIYHRFAQRPRNFLSYRTARLWVTPRVGEFGPEIEHDFFLKVGTDSENFYLFRTSLPEGARHGAEAVEPDDWLPELVVEFDEWLDLRQAAEDSLILNPRGAGDPPIELWSADSTYAVVLSDRGRAPNLAAVREVSMGVWNGEPAPVSGEVWVNELRLGRPVRDIGTAGTLDLTFDGGGVLSASIGVTDRGAFFRQLRDDPSYQDDREVTVRASLALDRFMSAEWGVDVPVTVEHRSARHVPRLLAESDVRTDRINGLRTPGSSQTRVGISFRRAEPASSPWVGALVDDLGARVSYLSSEGSSVAAGHESDNLEAGVEWAFRPAGRYLSLVPSFARNFIRAILPAALEDEVAEARLRLTPVRMSVGMGYARRDGWVRRFTRIVSHPDDELAQPTPVAREVLETAADLAVRPLGPLRAEVSFRSARDLLPPEEVSPDLFVRRVLSRERWEPLGLDLGWETRRSLTTGVEFAPELTEWLGGEVRLNTRYLTDRNPQYFTESAPGPQAARLLTATRDASGRRDWRASFFLDPPTAAAGLSRSSGESLALAVLGRLIDFLHPLSASYDNWTSSRFDRDPVSPGISYQMGWGSADSFRQLEGDTAATATAASGWTFRGGVDLPGGFRVVAGLRDGEVATFDTRSDRVLRERRWPDVQASLPALSMPSWSGVSRISLSGGIVRSELDSELGSGLQRRYERSTDLPASVSVVWLGSLRTSYETRFRSGISADPTGELQPGGRSHRLTLTTRFLPPLGIAARLDRPIDVSLLGFHYSESNCRLTVAADECVPFVDRLTRSLSLSLDTSVQGFELGAQFSYDDRRSFVGRQPGSTQLRLLVFGEMRMSAGSFGR